MVASTKSMKLNLTFSSNKKTITAIEIDENCKVEELKKVIFASKIALRPARQRITLPSVHDSKSIVLEDGKTIASYGLKDGDFLVVKDLGPQVSWRTVFFVEYLGPLIIHQIFFLYHLNSSMAPSFTQMCHHPLSGFTFVDWVMPAFHFIS